MITQSKELFQVITVRDFGGTPMRSTRICATRDFADLYIEQCQAKGIEVVSYKHWKLVEDIKIPEVMQ